MAGRSYLTTHDMREAETLCDSIVIMNQGRVVAHGSVPDLLAAAGVEQGIWIQCRINRRQSMIWPRFGA